MARPPEASHLRNDNSPSTLARQQDAKTREPIWTTLRLACSEGKSITHAQVSSYASQEHQTSGCRAKRHFGGMLYKGNTTAPAAPHHLLFDIHGFPFLEQHRTGSYQSYATFSFCCKEQQAVATPAFMLCNLATKTNELECADHGGYPHVHVGHRYLTVSRCSHTSRLYHRSDAAAKDCCSGCHYLQGRFHQSSSNRYKLQAILEVLARRKAK